MRKHLSLARSFASLLSSNNEHGTIIVILASLGDILIASGVIRKIAQKEPGNTVVVISERSRPITEILDLPDVQWISVGSGPILNCMRMTRLFSKRWKRVVNVTYSSSCYAHEICDAANAKAKYWFNGAAIDGDEPVPDNLTDIYCHIVDIEAGSHELDKGIAMLNALGCPAKRADVYPAIRPDLVQYKKQVHPFKIAVCPGGRFSSKRWGGDCYGSLIEQLSVKWPDAEIAIIGDARDAGAAAEILQYAKDVNVRDLCGKLSIEESVKEIAGSSVCIGNDSFALHAAIAVGTPSVVVMGGGDFPRWIPWKDTEKHRMVTGACDHRGCGWQCQYEGGERYKCVRGISVDDVAREMEDLISKVEGVKYKV